MQYDFIATPCSMNGEPGYMVKQLRPDGSTAAEGWQPNLDSLEGITIDGYKPRLQIVEKSAFSAPKKGAKLHLLHP